MPPLLFISTLPKPLTPPPFLHTATCQARAPRTFVRLHITPQGALHLQTAITTYNKTTQSPKHTPHTLQLHSLLHTADPSYYRTLQTSLNAQSSIPQTALLFELLTDIANLTSAPLRRLKSPIQPTPSASALSLSLRAVSHAAALNFRLPNAFIADLPRTSTPSRPPFNLSVPPPFFLTPFAVLLPFPELQFLLADAASGTFSPLVLDALLRFHITRARRHAYAARAVLTTNVRQFHTLDQRTVLRNRAATHAAHHAVRLGLSHIVMLYGAWHSPYLCRWAEGLAMTCESVEWRTAMVLQRDGWASTTVGTLYTAWSAADPTNISLPFKCILVWTAVVTTYAVYAAADWIACVDTLIQLWSGLVQFNDASLAVFLYLIRHIAPYLALRRWVVSSRDNG